MSTDGVIYLVLNGSLGVETGLGDQSDGRSNEPVRVILILKTRIHMKTKEFQGEFGEREIYRFDCIVAITGNDAALFKLKGEFLVGLFNVRGRVTFIANLIAGDRDRVLLRWRFT